MTTNQRRLTAFDKVVYKRHRMLVRQPLHDALLLTADIRGQDEEGVRQGGALYPRTRSRFALQRRFKREEIDHHSLNWLETLTSTSFN